MTSDTKRYKNDTLSIRESVVELKRSAIWIRRLLRPTDNKKAVLDGTKDENGHWRVSKASIEQYKQVTALKEQKRLASLESGSTYNYVRPRAQTIQMMRRALKEYKFDQVDLEGTSRVLDILEATWTSEYEAKRAKRSKK